MKNRNLINEVTRIQEMMGVKLITEKVLDYFIKPIIKAGEKGIETAEIKSLRSAIESSLDDVLKAVDNPLTKKMETAGIRTIDDLAKLSEKGLTKAEVKKIEQYMADNIIKKLETTGQSNIIDRIKLDVFDSTPQFSKFKDKVTSTSDAWGNGKLIDDEIELAKAEVKNLQRMKLELSKSGLNENEMRLLNSEIDDAIVKIEKNITESGGSLEKAGETAATDAIEDEVADNLAPEIKTDVEDAFNASESIDFENLFKLQNPEPEDMVKTFWDTIQGDMKKAPFYQTLRTEAQKTEFSNQVYGILTKWAKEGKVVSEKVLKNNEKAFDTMIELWSNPSMKPSDKMKMMEQASKELGLKWTKRDMQYWGNYIFKPWTKSSTGEMISPFTKEGFGEYFKKYMLINIGIVGFGTVKNIITQKNIGFDNLPGDNAAEKFMNLFKPGESLLKTFLPFTYTYPISWAIGASTNELRAPSEKELIAFLITALPDANDKTKYTISVDTDNKLTLLKNKDGQTVGSYSYNNPDNKVVVNSGINPANTVTTPQTTVTPAPVTGGQPLTESEASTFLTGKGYKTTNFKTTQKDANTVVVEFKLTNGTTTTSTLTKENGDIKVK